MQFHALLSILHRITGLALLALPGVLLVWLWAVAAGASTYAQYQHFWLSPLGQLSFYSLVLVGAYHTLNGLRHIGWDMGWLALTPQGVKTSGIIVLALTALAVILTTVWLR